MIKILSEDTIQKIAAGEVIERPVSIIKELFENSIDASSDEIFVEIKNGGKSFIKIVDNGIGIKKDEIDLAFTRHATSKINNFDDLYKLFTMGFRGEALASIVACAKVDIYTRHNSESIGSHVSFDMGKKISEKSIAMNFGTRIEVKDLFNYIPARKNFLASDISESNKITSIMYSFALANLDKAIKYVRDGRVIFETNKSNSEMTNLKILYGKDYIDHVLNINSSSPNYKLYGYISDINFYKGNRSMQHIYVNKRFVENDFLVQEIEKIYRPFISQGKFPAFQLFIECDPKNIDINISPNKKKIKFFNLDELVELINISIDKSIDDNKKAKQIKKNEEKIKEKKSFYKLNDDSAYKRVLDAYNNPSNKINELSSNKNKILNLHNKNEINNLFIMDDKIDYGSNNVNNMDDKIDLESYVSKEISISDNNKKINSSKNLMPNSLNYIGLIFRKYLIFEDLKNKLYVIDRQRAKERLLYDRILTSYHSNDRISQPLLSPIIIELSSKDYEKYLNNKLLFNNIGFKIDDFGQNTLALREMPLLLSEPEDKESFMDILDIINVKDNNFNKYEYIKIRANKKSLKLENNISDKMATTIYEELQKSSNMFTTEYGKKIIYELNMHDFIRLLK